MEVMQRHLAQLHAAYGESIGVRVARKHISWYLEGRPGAGQYRNLLMRCHSAREQFQLLTACCTHMERQEPPALAAAG